MSSALISQLGLKSDTLSGETIIVTGAGGGIGFEAARALLWLGANVVIAEIDATRGQQAEEELSVEFDAKNVLFIQTDVGDEVSVEKLSAAAFQRFGQVDGVINNATIAVLGMVKDLPIEKWDFSYKVNLRGPVLMAKTFLPGMIKRNHGTFACVSSTGTAYLGGYETFKAAQVHLANTLDAELEGTQVNAFTIGPGLVRTNTAISAVSKLAPQMGMSVEEFYELNKNAILSPEEAGVGFALALVYADKFRGMEISSLQAIKAADINYGGESTGDAASPIDQGKKDQAVELCKRVLNTLMEQTDGWKHRSIFERQWVIRDFKKTAGMSGEEWLDALNTLLKGLEGDGKVVMPPLEKLAGYYDHLADLAKGYEKNAVKLEENLRYVYGWRDEVIELESLIK
jgi:NAD(P)-dependent dehydrogenase (short-subunit alcohol dehydrogenase family)